MLPARTRWRSTAKAPTGQATGTLGPAPFDCIGEGFLSLAQLADGTVLFPVLRSKAGADEPASRVWGESFSHDVFRSNDGGRTWCDPAPTYDGACETHLLQLQNGNLLAAFRYQRPIHSDESPDILEQWGAKRDAAPGTAIFKHVFLADSEDGGNTWENLRPLLTEDGEPLLVFGETHGQLVQVRDGRIVVVHDRRYPYEGYEVRGRLSHDDGMTWDPDIYLVLVLVLLLVLALGRPGAGTPKDDY